MQDFYYYRGRIGLFHYLQSLGLQKGSLVAIQPYTCVAVPEAVIVAGLQPVYVDIDLKTLAMSPAALEQLCQRQILGAIVVQYTFGLAADLPALVAIANKYNIPVIADCCHISPFNEDIGKFVNGCDAAFFSFEWGKPVAVGIGGMLRVYNQDLQEKIQQSYTQFRQPSTMQQLKIELQYIVFKWCYRPKTYWLMKKLFHKLSKLGFAEGNFSDDLAQIDPASYAVQISPKVRKRLQQAIGSNAQIQKHMRANTESYLNNLGCKYIKHVDYAGLKASCDPLVRFPIYVENKSDFLRWAEYNNVEVAGWYVSPIHPLENGDLKAVGYQPGSCPNAEQACQHMVSLPTNGAYKAADIHAIIDRLNRQ